MAPRPSPGTPPAARARVALLAAGATGAAIALALGPGCSVEYDAPPPLPAPTLETRNPRSCPDQPAAGGPCEEGAVCTYQPCARDGITRLECRDGRYAIARTTPCNPPVIADCPAIEPIEGARCTTTTGRCHYSDTCVDRPRTSSSPVRSWSCPSGTWRLTTPRYTARCPDTPPTGGASCETCGPFYPEECAYRGCVTRCDLATATWRADGSSCSASDAGAADASGE